jgi:hypothetical protein
MSDAGRFPIPYGDQLDAERHADPASSRMNVAAAQQARRRPIFSQQNQQHRPECVRRFQTAPTTVRIVIATS